MSNNIGWIVEFILDTLQYLVGYYIAIDNL